MPTTESELVHAALRKYGYQSQSYNILSGEKRFFFSERGTEGVVAYVVIARVALVAGDPVCADSDIRDLCAEFLQFCKRNKWRCAFQSVTLRTLEQLQYLKFGYVKIGEEPFFRLRDFSLAGGQFRDLRRDIRRAQSDGLKIIEYRPATAPDAALDQQMTALSDEWRSEKGSGEFGFLVGQPSLDDPGDRKYFVATLNGQVEAFCVCTPIYARNAIYFDILRRKRRPVRGTVELLIVDSIRQLKEQGYELATLGTAPLSGEHAGPGAGLVYRACDGYRLRPARLLLLVQADVSVQRAVRPGLLGAALPGVSSCPVQPGRHIRASEGVRSCSHDASLAEAAGGGVGRREVDRRGACRSGGGDRRSAGRYSVSNRALCVKSSHAIDAGPQGFAATTGHGRAA